MTHAELCAHAEQHAGELLKRFNGATGPLVESAINEHVKGWHWSIAEITEHLHLSTSSYLPLMEQAVSKREGGHGSKPCKQSFLGKVIEYGAGPRTASPAPRQLFPKPGPYDKATLNSLSGDLGRLIGFLSNSRDLDLSIIKFKNPFMSFVRLNMVDGIKIITAHTERHVTQIETISKTLRAH